MTKQWLRAMRVLDNKLLWCSIAPYMQLYVSRRVQCRLSCGRAPRRAAARARGARRDRREAGRARHAVDRVRRASGGGSPILQAARARAARCGLRSLARCRVPAGRGASALSRRGAALAPVCRVHIGEHIGKLHRARCFKFRHHTRPRHTRFSRRLHSPLRSHRTLRTARAALQRRPAPPRWGPRRGDLG